MKECPFSKVKKLRRTSHTNSDLQIQSERAYQRKMLFNQDLNEQAQKVIFSFI